MDIKLKINKDATTETLENFLLHLHTHEERTSEYRNNPFRSVTIILPIVVMGGMDKRIWKEERVRFEHVCHKRFDRPYEMKARIL